MPAGEEKTVLKLSSIFKYIALKLSLLALWMIWAYVDPTWFPQGVTIGTVFWTIGILSGLDVILLGILLGIVGIRQEVRVRKGSR